MAYVAVKGGEAAIDAAHAWLAEERRGDPALPELTVEQIGQQLGLGVDRVMAEGACYDRGLAALAIKQARGDLIEAIFLVRAYRTTLPRFGYSEPVQTARMAVRRRVSATFKDLPGGQVLGPTFDYTHRLLDFSLASAPESHAETSPRHCEERSDAAIHGRALSTMDRHGLRPRDDDRWATVQGSVKTIALKRQRNYSGSSPRPRPSQRCA